MPRARLAPRLAAVVVASALACAAAAGAAQAPTGSILFTRFSYRIGHPRLATIELGGRARLLPSPAAAAAAPAWSPSGSLIAFVAGSNLSQRPDFSGPTRLWIARPDGRRARVVTHGRTRDGAPAFSPDGRRLVFVRISAAGTRSSLWVVGVSGSGARRLTRGRLDIEPSWSRDGRIVFVRIDPRTYQSGIWVTDAHGRAPRRILRGRPGLSDPVWSPDGRTLAVEDGRALYTVRADGSRFRLVARLTSDAQGTVADPQPAWSPDGRYLAFAALRPGTTGRSDVLVVPAAGGTPRRVTRSPGLDSDPAWGP